MISCRVDNGASEAMRRSGIFIICVLNIAKGFLVSETPLKKAVGFDLIRIKSPRLREQKAYLTPDRYCHITNGNALMYDTVLYCRMDGARMRK